MADSEIGLIHSGGTSLDLLGLEGVHVQMDLTLPQPLKTDLGLPQPLKTEVKADLSLPQPFRSDLHSEVAFPEPIRSQVSGDLTLDVRPLEADVCLNVRLAPLPRTIIRQPYQQHFGVTLFGVELLGFDVTGEVQTVIDEFSPRPHAVWGTAPVGPAVHQCESDTSRAGRRPHPPPGALPRIRLAP